MKNETDKKLLFMVPVVVITFIYIIALIGDTTSAFYAFVYNFQAMNTGLMAILAAYITIGQMRKSDERADIRHQQMVLLAMKVDKKTYEHAKMFVRAFDAGEKDFAALASDHNHELPEEFYYKVWKDVTEFIDIAGLASFEKELPAEEATRVISVLHGLEQIGEIRSYAFHVESVQTRNLMRKVARRILDLHTSLKEYLQMEYV